MTTHRFYIDEPLANASPGRLSPDQTRQARKVLRLRPGDRIVVFDGSGAEYDAELCEPERDGWTFRLGVKSRPQREPALRLSVGLSAIRNERFDMAVQKLTELGVAEIVPLQARRSVISYEDARIWEKRRARLERIVIEAAEQSERTTLPQLRAPLTVSEFLDRFAEAEVIALVERSGKVALSDIRPAEAAALMVGPEGGWTPDEMNAISESGATLASMGRLILRAETAAIVAAGHLTLANASEGSTAT